MTLPNAKITGNTDTRDTPAVTQTWRTVVGDREYLTTGVLLNNLYTVETLLVTPDNPDGEVINKHIINVGSLHAFNVEHHEYDVVGR